MICWISARSALKQHYDTPPFLLFLFDPEQLTNCYNTHTHYGIKGVDTLPFGATLC